MATRSQVQFGEMREGKFERTAQIYHHWDGYPESRLHDIKRAIVKAHESYGTSPGMGYRVHTTYPSDLAAFYILANKDGAGNVEIDEHLHGDEEYVYQVWQDTNGIFNVVILTSHQPEGEPYDEKKWKDYWDNPSVDKLRVEAEGELEDLLVRYSEDDSN